MTKCSVVADGLTITIEFDGSAPVINVYPAKAPAKAPASGVRSLLEALIEDDMVSESRSSPAVTRLISDRIGVRPRQARDLIKRAHDAGWVALEHDHDGRLSCLSITASGGAAVAS